MNTTRDKRVKLNVSATKSNQQIRLTGLANMGLVAGDWLLIHCAKDNQSLIAYVSENMQEIMRWVQEDNLNPEGNYVNNSGDSDRHSLHDESVWSNLANLPEMGD